MSSNKPFSLNICFLELSQKFRRDSKMSSNKPWQTSHRYSRHWSSTVCLCDASSWMSGGMKLIKINAILASVIPSLVSVLYHLCTVRTHRWEPTNIQKINQWLPETKKSVMKEHDNLVKISSERQNILPKYPYSWVTDFLYQINTVHPSFHYPLPFPGQIQHMIDIFLILLRQNRIWHFM